MPLPDFEGETFLAFMDISGFKKLMKENKAQEALDNLHSHGYDIIDEHGDISAILASDSCILFVNNKLELIDDTKYYLSLLLDKVKEMNRNLIKDKIMVTTSIAYGQFRYEKRVEFNRIEKNHFFGNVYVDAFLDNEYDNKKIKPGECRLLVNKFPESVKNYLKYQDSLDSPSAETSLGLLRKEGKYYYFYWMLKKSENITNFKNKYTRAYESRYRLLKNLLKEETETSELHE
jgi:hypothetical protein